MEHLKSGLNATGQTYPKFRIGDITATTLDHINKCVMPKGLQGGFVYVAKSNIGLVKVGKTRNVPARIKQLSSGSGVVITDVFCTSVEQKYSEIESRSHCLLSAYSCAGEWFSADFEVVKQVVQQVANELHAEPIPRVKHNPYHVYLWICANVEQEKLESVLLDILSDESKNFLRSLGAGVPAYIASYIHAYGAVILLNNRAAHEIYPNGYRNAELSVIEAEWKQVGSEGEVEESDLTDHILDISNISEFNSQAESWRNQSVSKYFSHFLNIEKLALAHGMEAN
ncbi:MULTISPECIES: GIY-YIG nuclease family protein [Xenorhabdus]|uniref:GIY-YIG nuclease family protein n=1 Tax=Xenorhabdus TaxID=626 RepID=UPI000649F29B|nr:MULTISPECIES: GIY-YIG nuclease family protein [Xenorhabdus]KLU14168.1 hypothetical protein AAY47_17905 [Xenorhabdus griffiniae]KOP32969.1 hypothetical protein AFK69_13090 [Xenorhabdus sp. GDc328]